jgi:putative restriction endonuclease
VAELADYLDLTVSQARQQFRELKLRSPVSSGRQAVFLPVETLLCLAVSFLVNHRRFGGSTAHLAPEPIPSLARLFSPLRDSILLPASAQPPAQKYLEWHQDNVFAS